MLHLLHAACDLCDVAVVAEIACDKCAIAAMSQRLQQCRRDRSDVAFVACDRSDVAFVACNKCDMAEIANLIVYDCPSSWKYTGNEKRDWKFAQSISSWHLNRFIIIIFFTFLIKKKWEGGLIFSQQNVFLHNNCEQVYFILFFLLSHREEMRSGTHFTQQNVFLPVVVVRKLTLTSSSRFLSPHHKPWPCCCSMITRHVTEVEGIDNAPVIIRHLLSIGITTVTGIKLIITNSLNSVHTKK